MNLNRRIIAVLALTCVLASSAFAGGALAGPKKKTGNIMSKLAQAAAESEQPKDLLTRLLESGGLTQKNVDDIKAYLEANPAAPAEGADAENPTGDNAVLNKLGALVKDGKIKQKVLDSLSDLLNQAKATGENINDIGAKLTQAVLDAMQQASVITEKESAAIVAQMTQDLLDTALNGKVISQKNFDVIQEALKEAPAASN